MRTLAALLALTAAIATRRAEACSGCAYPKFTPRAPLPVNLPALPAMPGTPATLTGPDGGEVTTEAAPEGIHPVTPPTQGVPYTLTAHWVCTGEPVDSTVTFGPPAPLPQSAGTLTQTARTGDFQTPTTAGSCTTAVRGAGAELDLTPSTELEPWLPLTRATLVVGGEAIDQSLQYGTSSASSHYRFALFTVCGGLPAGASPGLKAGKHHGELKLHVAGMSEDLPALPFDVELECPPGCSASPGPLLLLGLAAWLSRRGRREC
ncbi:MAG: hypothetical protein IPJ65_18890 [Archangiaceae bacterium]|nr:hypothetical protein [Archangiaceae bacterium]